MRKSHTAVALFLAIAPVFAAAAPAAWKPPARSAYDPAKDKVLYEVGYSHLDTQWRWTYLDTIGQYIPDTMRDNIALMDKYPDYTFSFSGANRYRMMKEYYPKEFAKVKEYIRKNRWHVSGSSWEENDVNVPSSESIVRQLLYGSHYFRNETGASAVDFILPDCFGFPASLPSILVHCGIKGFSTQKLSWGSAVGIPFTVGNWYGTDGRFVTSALDAGPYGARVNEDLSQSQWILNRIDKIGDQSGAYVDYRYYGTGDVGGAPTEGSVQWVQKSVHGDGPVTVVSAPSDQMFKDLTPAQVAKLPTYKGDLLLTEHSAGSITSQAYMKRWNRKNELLADSAERASVAADWLGGSPYPHRALYEAWKLILGAQFHDILPGTSLPKAYEYSWNDEVVALNHSAGALSAGAGAVTRAMDTRAQGASVVVYNPLSVARQDVVNATVNLPRAAASVRVYGPNGQEVPSQVVKRSGSQVDVLFLASVPSVSFSTFDVRPSAAPCAIATGLSVSKGRLANKRYQVTLNGNGDVAQITDKAAGRPLLSGPARLAFKFEEPSAWPAWNIDWKDQSAPPTGYVDGPARVRIVENGPVRVALEVTRHARNSTFVQVIRLAAGGNRVEWDNTIDWNARKSTLKAVFPMAVSNDLATYNLGMGAVKRPTNDPKKYEVPSHEWIDLTDASGSYGVSVLEDCKFGSDKPDDKTIRLTLIRTPGATSYEDEATQDVGHHRVLYAISGHKAGWQGKTPWEAARLNQPLVAFQTPAHAGRLGKSFSLLKLSNAQVAVVALKKAEDSSDYVVRLQNLSDQPSNVTVTTASRIAAAREVDGEERSIGSATLANGAIRTSLHGYGARAFAFRLGTPPARLAAPASRSVAIPYNVEAFGFDGRATAKGFDNQGHTFPAELAPASVEVDGVAFRFAKMTPGAKTALSCQGQTVRLPGGAYRRVYVLASAIGGDARGTFTAGAKSTPVTVQNWSGFIGQWDNRIWTRPAGSPGLQRLDGGIYGLTPAYIKRDPIAWFATHRHNARGGNDIYAYAYVFRYALDVPAGATTLTLPKNPAIRVFAISAAADANDTAQPAQPLYDTFSTQPSSPVLSPAAGQYSDATSVTIQPSLYDAAATIRYTTDGSAPTAGSPAYIGPVVISRATTVRARAFHGSKASGPVVSATYRVNDNTAPTVTGIVAADGSPLVRIAFSEPVDPASASNAAAYRIESLTIQSAKVAADGRSVDLTVSPAPSARQSSTLVVEGVKDTSPNANTVAMAEGRPFTAAAPLLELIPATNGPGSSLADLNVRTIGTPSTIDGPVGPAMSFNGTMDALSVASRPELNPAGAITVSAWIRPVDWKGNGRIVQKGNQDSQLRFTASEGSFLFELAGVGQVTCALPSVNAWHHVAGTYDGSVMRLYVDGVEAAHTDASGSIASTDDPLNIGTKTPNAAAVDHFHGDLADVRLYDQALLPEHIRVLAAR